MNRILAKYMFFFTVFAFSQDSIQINSNSSTKNDQTILSDLTQKKSSKLNDTIIHNLDESELIIPLERDSLTKVIMVKEQSKVDWLKYLLPIFTLFLGIWIKEHLEKRSNKSRIIKSGERWIAELGSLDEPIKKQIQVLEEYAKDIGKEDFKIRNLQVYSSLDGELFKSLDKSELIKYIELNNKNTEFKKIVEISNSTNGYVSILVHLYKTLQEKFDRYLSGTSKHTTSLTLSLQEFSSAFKNYGVELEKELHSNPFYDHRYKPIADLYSAQIVPNLKDGKFNPFVLKKQFFIPLVDILAHLRLDPRTKDLSSAMTNGLNAIKGIELEKDYMSKNLNSIITQYKEQLTELERLINKIINTKHNN